MMNRRTFCKLATAAAYAAATANTRAAGSPSPAKAEYHVFSKMFQDITSGYDGCAELMAKAGFDGIEWTVRPKGHVEPANAKTDLPKAVAATAKFGLKSTMMVTSITRADEPGAEELLRIAADNGFKMFRPGYYFYDEKKESFKETVERVKRSFAGLEKLCEKTGMKCCYQNHSSWGPSIFGGVIWDIYECIKDLDPKYIAMEYDPMHAFFETGHSWSHGMELVADRIGAVCLKDFHYQLSKKDPKDHAKFMCAAGDGIVPWTKVREILKANNIAAPFIVHFEYDFPKDDLLKSVKTELDVFKKIFG